MPRKSQHTPACPNDACEVPSRVHRHGLLRTRHGRKRRYLCKACGQTFVTSRGTPYFRIQSSRAAFDRVVALSVEGISISAIARLQGKSWSTVSGWLERAAAAADRFSDRRLRDFELLELQLDEMRSFALGKDKPTWIYAALEVSSRLWTTAHTGRRGWQPTLAVMRDVAARALPGAVPLIATDGYRYYKPAIRKTLGGFCVYGQVIKTRRKDRVVKVERTLVVGERVDLANAIERSEDSSTINTSFIERLNLSIRQGVGNLGRRVACHARSVKRLAGQLEILRLFYNFIRPHSALQFGREVRTPAQQAGLASRRLTWRQVFCSADARSLLALLDRALRCILGSQWRPRIVGQQQ